MIILRRCFNLLCLAVCVGGDLTSWGAPSALSAVSGWSGGFQPGKDNSGSPWDQFYSSPVVSSSGVIYLAGFLQTAANDQGGGTQERHLYAINPGSPSAPTVAWRASLGNVPNEDDDFFMGTESTPALGPDGTIYIGTSDFRLRAFNPNGTTKWTYPSSGSLDGPIRGAPIIGPDPTTSGAILIYSMVEMDLQAQGTKVFLLILRESSGSVSWVSEWPPSGVSEPPGRAISSPALGRDGVVYFGIADVWPRANNNDHTSRGWLYAINVSTPSSPTKSWQYPAANVSSADEIGAIVGSPAIASDGTIYVPSQWHAGSDGNPDRSGRLLALNPSDGSLLWKYDTSDTDIVAEGTTEGAIDSSPTIGPDGTIYIGVDAPINALIAINPTTRAKDWFFKDTPSQGQTLGGFETSPVIAPDGTIYVRAINFPKSTIYGIVNNGSTFTQVSETNLDAEDITHHSEIQTQFSNLALTPDGRLYSASASSPQQTGAAGKLWCFQTGSSGYSFWPKFRGNTYNTGSVQDSAWTAYTVAGTSASISNLVSYPTSGNNQAAAVNILGKTVGLIPYSGHTAASAWTMGTQYPSQMTGLSAGYYYNFIAYGLNDNNQAVGAQTMDGYGTVHALYWSSLTATPTDLARPSGFTDANAYEINRNGMIVGDGKNSSGLWRALRWNTSSSTPADLQTLGGSGSGLQSYAYGVSARGWTVGKSQSTSGGVFRGFAINPINSTLSNSRDSLSPSDQSEAHSINGLGQIVGGSKNGATAEHAWMWSVNFDGSISSKDIGTLNGGTSSRALSINNRGQIVGWASTSGGATAAFIWIPGWNAVRDLKSFLSSADASNWSELTVATGITDEGMVVGYGKLSGSSYTTGFALKPKP